MEGNETSLPNRHGVSPAFRGQYRGGSEASGSGDRGMSSDQYYFQQRQQQQYATQLAISAAPQMGAFVLPPSGVPDYTRRASTSTTMSGYMALAEMSDSSISQRRGSTVGIARSAASTPAVIGATPVPTPSPSTLQQIPGSGVGTGTTPASPLSRDTTASNKPIRRRMRMITSCLECRRRKLRCDKQSTCSNCLKFNRQCHYLPNLDEDAQLRLTEIKEKVGSLERQFESDVAKSGGPAPSGDMSFPTPGPGAASRQQRILADDVEHNHDEERDLEITPMVALDLMYDDDADGTDDIIDLGIQVGRMRITERIGGLNRPRISEEVSIPDGFLAALNAILSNILAANQIFEYWYTTKDLTDRNWSINSSASFPTGLPTFRSRPGRVRW